jgi:putative ABC transport system ATP-binding protein
MDLFGELNADGITVVMVTHEADVARSSRRIIWFRDGAVIHDRLTPEELSQLTLASLAPT